MKPLHRLMTLLAAGVSAAVCVAPARAQPVVIETVPVGNPGNPGEPQGSGQGSGVFGGVDYDYHIGRFEVTAGQYTAFLNAVAATDTYSLYHTRMDYDADTSHNGCNIKRQGVSGSYTYSVAPDWADRPVNYASWADAARFANWLHNGQPTGAQDLATTEDGSYFLDGTDEGNVGALEDITREPDATWAIPSEDEWYKAAYHKNDGVTGNYWNYPTQADTNVSNTLVDPDPGNHATFGGTTIGAPYDRTEVGAHENSASAYGTFDQGGNVQEFNEAVPDPPDTRGVRGGSWFWGLSQLNASERPIDMHSEEQLDDLGFRVVNLAGPSQSVPALSVPGLLALSLGVALVATLALRVRLGSGTG
jgi:formylglycine-generating enzyme required for sulfatase activity